MVGAENAKPPVDVGADDAGAEKPKPLLGVADVDDAGAENAKPLVVVDVEFDEAPNANNDDEVEGAPNDENDGTDVAGLSAVVEAEPNVLAAPNAGVVVVVLLVEITEGANGLGGLLAPKVNGVLFEAVVVVVADGKLKPAEDVDVDEELAPNSGTVAVVVVAVAVGRNEDEDVDEVALGNENPPTVVVAGNDDNEDDEDVVLGAAAVDEKANKLGVVEAVVAAETVVDDTGARDEVEEPAPNVNKAGLSDNVVEDTALVVVEVGNGVLVNEPNVGTVDAAAAALVVVVVEDKAADVPDVVAV